MKNTPEISLIVPIYNVEKYLDKALKSIENQRLENGVLQALIDKHGLIAPAAVLSFTDITVGAENGGVSIFDGNKTEIRDYYTVMNTPAPTEGVSEPIQNSILLEEYQDGIFMFPNVFGPNVADVSEPDMPEENTLTLSAKTGGKLVI